MPVEDGEQRLQRWDQRARPAIVLAALLPIIASVTASELAALRAELAEVNRRLSTLQSHLGIADEPSRSSDDR